MCGGHFYRVAIFLFRVTADFGGEEAIGVASIFPGERRPGSVFAVDCSIVAQAKKKSIRRPLHATLQLDAGPQAKGSEGRALTMVAIARTINDRCERGGDTGLRFRRVSCRELAKTAAPYPSKEKQEWVTSSMLALSALVIWAWPWHGTLSRLGIA
jgi:hypothetical protein